MTEPGDAADALLERDEERANLQRLLMDAADARGGVLVVEGDLGIGKTRLWEAARAAGRELGFIVLGARGRELERDLHFGVARQLFEPQLIGTEGSRAEAFLRGPAARAKVVLGLAAPDALALGDDAANGARDGLYRLCLNLAATAPVLVAVDDVHWCDPPSLGWISYLSRRIEQARVAVVLTVRPAIGHGEGPELAAIDEELVSKRVRPRPLSGRAVAELAASFLGREVAADFAAACRAASGGNPFLLQTLLGTLRDERVEPSSTSAHRIPQVTPRRISERIVQQLRGMPGVVGAVARTVSLLDRPSMADVVSVAELDPREVAEAVDALAEVGILAPDRPLEFLHPLFRSAVYASMRPTERSRGHRRAARWLAESEASADEVAAQVASAEPNHDAWAVERLLEAAALARARGAPEAALRHLRRALVEPPGLERRATVMRELGSVELQLGEPAALERLQRALALTEDPIAQASVSEELARAMTMAGRLEEAVAVLDRAASAAVGVDRERSLRLRAAQFAAAAALTDPDARVQAWGQLAQLQELAGETPAERLVLSAMAFHTIADARPAHESVALATRAMAGGELIAELTADAPFLYASVMVPVLTDRFDLAHAWLKATFEDARVRQSRIGEALALGWLAELDYRKGALGHAEEHARRSLELAEAHGYDGAIPVPLTCLLQVLIEADRLKEGERILTSLGLASETQSPFVHFRLLRATRGHLRIAHGRLEEGVSDLRASGSELDGFGFRTPVHVPWRSWLATGLAALGDAEEARALSDQEVRLSRAIGAPTALSRALRVAGQLRPRSEGIDLLGEAAAVLQSSGAILERSHALIELGAALRRAGRRRDAREPLRLGLDLSSRCGARPLAARAHDELLATGAKPRREAFRGPDSLTPSERRVADLAAAGLSNAEIARRLSVTVRTVELHLTRTYAKLQIGSRKEVARALGADPD
jgi:DNA-binding CsgD family transcriptional regulator